MARCERCNACQSQWAANYCNYCGYPGKEKRAPEEIADDESEPDNWESLGEVMERII